MKSSTAAGATHRPWLRHHHPGSEQFFANTPNAQDVQGHGQVQLQPQTGGNEVAGNDAVASAFKLLTGGILISELAVLFREQQPCLNFPGLSSIKNSVKGAGATKGIVWAFLINLQNKIVFLEVHVPQAAVRPIATLKRPQQLRLVSGHFINEQLRRRA